MDLQHIVERVLSPDDSLHRVLNLKYKNNKELSLGEVREWIDTYLNDVDSGNLKTDPDVDVRPGRVGASSVYFSLDRSFGIVGINQEGLNVISACKFATVAATSGVFSGKWMYEIQLNSKGIMQIGWCSNKCIFTADRGCGDTIHSYAYDGSRKRTWNVISESYGEKWKTGDVLNVCINLNERTIEFYRNGHSLGPAFSNISVGAGIIYIPCISLVDAESASANFGSRPFHHYIPGYEPLQQFPLSQAKQMDVVLQWLKNLTCLQISKTISIANCNNQFDISDYKFWNRFYSIMFYHINNVITNKYCLLNNFLSFICEILDTHKEEEILNNQIFFKIMDEMWLYTKDSVMDKVLLNILNHLTGTYKQVSESLDCPTKMKTLNTVKQIFSHKKTRKYIISNFLFDKINLLLLFYSKSPDDSVMESKIQNAWWDTDHQNFEIEKNKTNYHASIRLMKKSFNNLESKHLEIIRLMLINTDGTENEPSTRVLFLNKFRRYCWHEWEYDQHNLGSRLPSTIVYCGFVRFVKILFELWENEMPGERLMCPTNYFYDRTLKYKHCDRIGGLEQYLVNTLRAELMSQLGDLSQLFQVPNERNVPSLQITLGEIVRLVNGEHDHFLPSTSSAPVLHAIYPLPSRDVYEEIECGNADKKKSLVEFFDDLIILYTSMSSKHFKKINKTYSTFNQYVSQYNNLYAKYKTLNSLRSDEDPLVQNIKSSIELLKAELEKRSRKIAWILSTLLNTDLYTRLFKFFEAVHNSIAEAETFKKLFSFLPEFYLQSLDTLVQAFIKDFAAIKTIDSIEDGESLIEKVSDLAIATLDDNRIKHIDHKKIPVNILATLASNSISMGVLESLSPERKKLFVKKLMQPYTDRHWKGTNWILLRFWHGDGYGFRYSEFPHQSHIAENNPSETYAMYKIAPCSSKVYQELIKNELLDRNSSVPKLIDSMISELNSIFGEFLTQMQELQRALERNEQLLMFGKLYKTCASYFNKTIALIRVLDMYINLAPEIFIETYYSDSVSFTKRIIQIILLIIHRITSKQGCFRTVMNSRITVLENVDYLPIETACIAVLLGLLKKEINNDSETNLSIPFICKLILTDPSYNYENLKCLIGSSSTRTVIMSLHDYESEVLTSELEQANKLLENLFCYAPLLSDIKLIPDDDMCIICCSAPIEVKFKPCGHVSCLSCITYYLPKNRNCFFCKREINQVMMIKTQEIIQELDIKNVTDTQSEE